MRTGTQFLLLQWKNWKLQFRKKFTTVFEVLIPVIFCFLLMAIKTLVIVNVESDPILYPSYPITSPPAGLAAKINPTPFTPPAFGVVYTPKTNVTDAIMAKVSARMISEWKLTSAPGRSTNVTAPI